MLCLLPEANPLVLRLERWLLWMDSDDLSSILPQPLCATSTAVQLCVTVPADALLDVAAFLDRVDRAADGNATDDFRLKAFRQALTILSDNKSERARRVLELFSDPSREPIPAAGMKGADGAYRGSVE